MDNKIADSIESLVNGSKDYKTAIERLLADYSKTVNENYEQYQQKLAELQRLDAFVTESIIKANEAFEAARLERKQLYNQLLITESERLERETQEVAEWTQKVILELSPHIQKSKPFWARLTLRGLINYFKAASSKVDT